MQSIAKIVTQGTMKSLKETLHEFLTESPKLPETGERKQNYTDKRSFSCRHSTHGAMNENPLSIHVLVSRRYPIAMILQF
jgi:hypothetical protein